MRFVILTNADIGLYKFRKELIEMLCSENEVYIILPRGDYIDDLKRIGCKYIPFEFNRRGMNPLADLKQLIEYTKLLKVLKPDLVLTYTIKPNVYGGLACQRLHIPYISNITGLGTSIENGGLLGAVATSLYRIGLRKSSCVFFQNRNNEKLFRDKSIVKGITRVIPGSGVNIEAHKYEGYPPDDEGIRFLFVGRIMNDKGIEELLSAIKKIQSERSDVSLDIVGWSDEDYDKQLKEAEKDGAVVFHGLQKDVHPFYTACHCAVLPSYHEGTANVMLEASSTGRPVITTRVPGCKETFDEGLTGFGCEAKSVDSLVNAMRKFLSLPQNDRESMGKAARIKMEREYDRNIVLAAYMEEIKKSLGHT